VDPVREIVAAVEADDVARAATCLDRHPELCARLNDALPGLPFDGTLLLAAVSRRNRVMIDLLLQRGADINQRSHWWAGGFGVLDGDHDLTDFLVERGATMDIHAAARRGRVDIIKTLLEHDSTLARARGGDGQTPLHVAATVEVAKLLLDAGADINARDVDHESTAAQYAIRDRQDLVRFLVGQGCTTDVLMAAALGDPDLVRRHLDANPAAIAATVSPQWFPMTDPRAGGTIYIWTLGGNKSAHLVAHEFGRDEIFRLLMDRSSPQLALAAACDVGDEKLMKEVLEKHPDAPHSMNAAEQRKIVDAAEANRAETVRLMLNTGWPVSARGKHGATPLHFAAWHGNAAMAADLLRHRPQVEAVDDDFSMTALGWALHGSLHGWNADHGDYGGTVEALLDAGAVAPSPSADIQSSETVRAVLRRRRDDNRV
jgi:ankyrin repeat protein